MIRDRLGRIVSDTRPLVPAQHGATIELTIDRRIQQLAFSQLKAAVVENNAVAGSVVVLDAQNGEILALANYPTFDPNDRARLTGQQLRNRAVIDTFEPEPTIKPLVVALSIDERKVTPNTIINTSPGTYKIGPAVIHDTSNHGSLTVSQALQKSSNVALAKLALNLPAERSGTNTRNTGSAAHRNSRSRASRRAGCAATSAGGRSSRRRWRTATACRCRCCRSRRPTRPTPATARCTRCRC